MTDSLALGRNLKAAINTRFPNDDLRAFALRLGCSRSTLQKMIKGDGSVALGRYLGRINAVSIDPAQLPLRSAAFEFDCAVGVLPAFLDDYLPDTWGRKVLTALSFYRDQQKLNANSAIDLLRCTAIGALRY